MAVDLTGASNVAEGSAYTLTLGGTPSPGTTQFSIDWQDGSDPQIVPSLGAYQHTYADGTNHYNIAVQELGAVGGGGGGLTSNVPDVSGGDLPLAIAATSSGSVVFAADPDVGFVLLAYGAAGNQLSRTPIEMGDLDPLAGRSIAVDHAGNILIAGSVPGIEGTDFAVSRYAPDGTFLGTYSLSLGTIDEVALGVAVDSQNRIILSGYVDDQDTNFNVAVVRLTPEGMPDPTFGEGGVTRVALAGEQRGQAVAVAPDDSLVVIEQTTLFNPLDTEHPFSPGPSSILRFSASGAKNMVFGGDGSAPIDEGPAFAWAASTLANVAVDNQNRILIAGTAAGAGGHDMAMVRYTSVGAVDFTFAVQRGDDEGAQGIAVDSAGGILVLGNALNPLTAFDSDLLLARISEDTGTPPPPVFHTVTVDNVAPTAAAHALTVSEDGPDSVNVLVGVFDPGVLDAPTADAASFTTTPGGTVTILANGNATYNPSGHFEYLGVGETATDSFTYTVTDKDGDHSLPALVTVTIHGVNDAPIAAADSYSVTEDGVLTVSAALGVRANDSDVDAHDILTVTLLTGPAHGTLSLAADGAFTYTPGTSGGDFPTDTFTYTVSDGHGGTAIGSVSIAITKAVPDGAVVRTGTIVRVGGTSASDNMLLTKNGNTLYLNGVSTGVSLSGATEIRVWGRGGDDIILMGSISLKTYVEGGAGNDIITGGSGSNMIFGGAGNDVITGGNGSDFLIGGAGQDLIVGGNGSDILVAGEVDTGDSADALFAVLANWASLHATDSDLVGDVIDNLSGDSGDLLSGGNGADWFIVGNGDILLDLPWNHGGDVVTHV